MKFLLRIIIFIFFSVSLISLYSCQDCNDCDIYDKDPFVKVSFMNEDSLVKAKNRVAAIAQRITALQALDTEEADAEVLRLNAERDNLNKAITKINSKRFKVDSLRGAGTDKVMYFRDSTFNDSLIVFNFPLSMNDDISTFYIHARNQIDTLSVKYDRELINRENVITIRAYNLKILKHSFDSIPMINYSGSAKNSNETTITFTF